MYINNVKCSNEDDDGRVSMEVYLKYRECNGKTEKTVFSPSSSSPLINPSTVTDNGTTERTHF